MNHVPLPSGKLLVTGANGFIGRLLCAALINRQGSVKAAARNAGEAAPNIDTIAVGNIDGSTDWSMALQGIEVVIHLAARAHIMRDTAADPLAEFRKVNVDGTLNLAGQALQASVKRFIFISSIKVNGEATSPGRPFHADDAPTPEDAYGLSKREAEDGLRELCADSTMEFVIIRPPLVYGPGVKGNFFSMMRWLDKGIPLPFASIQNRRSLVAADNLVDLIITCIGHPMAANQIFLAGDGEDLSTPELLKRTAAALGKRARLLPVPTALLAFAARCLGKTAAVQKLCGSLQVNIQKTRSMLGWRPPVGVDQALRASAEHYLGVRK
ncbi:SDR family oxidoreductase [Methylomicrobium sp. Wu6]|uniref:UDP-glucose 4-epimerase family protein n=1 Tax=Methylomicrobium sp. Wu6 TaxID=3107928 RepID=UPI002DD67645|nr:SDR family oxidoreductase [Methylomicrobium sp. Wu6]MEC4747380.1 SDR family oxidoreductase [Methylomicrobium sp. Wu6]